MSLGSRIIKRGSAVTVTSPPTPREPLLFLYPQWINTSSTRASKLAYARNGRPIRQCIRGYATVSAPRSNTATGSSSLKLDEVELSEVQETEQLAQGDQNGERLEKSTPSLAATNAHLKQKKPQKRTSGLQPKKNAKEAPLAALDPHLKRSVEKAIRGQIKARDSVLRNRSVREAYQTERRERAESWVPDWRVILKQLRKHTPQRFEWLDKAVYVSVPEGAAENIFKGVDDNIWDIAARFEASVKLANRSSESKHCNKYILSGSAYAVRSTAKEVFRVAPGSRLEAGPRMLSGVDAKSPTVATPISSAEIPISDTLLPRLVLNESRRKIPAMRADKFPKPAKWTASTMVQYVTDLTIMDFPNYLHKLWYKKEENHIRAVVQALREVFSNPECRSSLSRKAFNQAIAFYVKTNQMPDARAAFVIMEMAEILPDPETFNIFLRGVAKQEDLHVFQFILHMMFKRGVVPNGQTWLAFLRANSDFRIKAHIVSAMKDKGLLFHQTTLQGVCEETISQETSASLDQGQSQEQFFQHMDTRYGDRWLTVNTGNRALHVIGARCLISRCWEFLEAMDARHVRPNNVSINTILDHCRKSTNVEGAIEIMKMLPYFVPDEHAYHSLFEMAWRTRSYNLTRVIWTYASLNVATTRRIRMLVRSSLLHGIENPEPLTSGESQNSIWRRQAGAVITGSIDRFMHTTTELLDGSSPPLTGLDLVASGPFKDKIQARREIDNLIDSHHRCFYSWIPTRPFAEMLLEAWELDLRWKKTQLVFEGSGLEWKLKEAITVPLREKGSLASSTLLEV